MRNRCLGKKVRGKSVQAWASVAYMGGEDREKAERELEQLRGSLIGYAREYVGRTSFAKMCFVSDGVGVNKYSGYLVAGVSFVAPKVLFDAEKFKMEAREIIKGVLSEEVLRDTKVIVRVSAA